MHSGSPTKVNSGCGSLRGGSIDSNLQLCGNGWMSTDEATLHSMLKKQTCFRGGKGEPLDFFPLESWESRNGLQKKKMDGIMLGDSSQLSSSLRKQNPSKLEVSSAAMETAQIKDKLKKRRMSDGILASNKGLADSSGSKELALKPAISRATSQRLLITSKPMPPIQSIPTSPEITDEREHRVLENSMDLLGNGGDRLESTAAPQQVQPKNLHGNNENVRKSLGAALIPPIPKSAKAHGENSQHFQETFLSSSQFDSTFAAVEDCSKSRSGPVNNAEENSLKVPETRKLESLPTLKNGLSTSLKVTGSSESLLPLTTHSLSMGLLEESGQISSSHLLKEDDWKESNGRIHVTISKSAQEKMRQKQVKEIELLRKEREKERSMKLPDQLQRTAQDGSGVLNSSEATIPVTFSLTNSPRPPAGKSLKKRVNRPSLPSIPVINHDSSFLRHASAYSLPATLNSPEWEEDLVNRDVLEVSLLSHPEQGLIDALKWLNSNDWQLKEKGLFSIRCLASCHSELLLCRLHDVSLAAMKEVSNLRSKVSRFAIGTLAELFKTLKKHMDQEVEEIARVLLQKTGDSSEFIQKAADQSLGIMAQNVTPSRALAALMANGVNHRNPLVRKSAAEHLLTVMEQIGAEKLLSGNRENMEMLVQMLIKLAQDCNQDTRFYGRRMLNILKSHSKFDGYLKQCLPSHDLRDVMATIKQKGAEDQSCQAPSAKSQRGSKSGSLTTSLDSMPSDNGSVSSTLALPQPMVRRSSFRSLEVIEQLKELDKMLVAKEFQMRMEGITLLMEHCKNNPQLVSSNIIQIFDAFLLRLQDSNKKVNQYALESIASMIPVLKDGLNPVMISVVTVVTDNLNSKNSGIYNAAVKVLDQMIISLDNALLLQTFASRVRFISGRALQDVTDRLSVLVTLVYPWKLQAVERHVLPVLWYFLSNMIGNGVLPGKSGNVRTVVAKLTKSLHKQMGPRLEEYASNQSQHVIKNLQDLLNLELQ
ncbi:TOG array regulator of axonemal microtubules protein 2 [Sphaerodactylus townsendi]|uniref:TOG array regulator of axonemal microtubules protein 2 n=1 Tax=Sphaerodactylus townsendi TaxID=933632 RepID=UPI002026250E|nr:TOG array regulator of axonemal microtubules protein 2 [Sphaerodactylus townsendi]